MKSDSRFARSTLHEYESYATYPHMRFHVKSTLKRVFELFLVGFILGIRILVLDLHLSYRYNHR